MLTINNRQSNVITKQVFESLQSYQRKMYRLAWQDTEFFDYYRNLFTYTDCIHVDYYAELLEKMNKALEFSSKGKRKC